MARIVKEYGVRRDEILDAAQRLICTKGYEQMTVQDILDDLQIAKGTLYHYFGSKQALLEAIIERMLGEVERFLTPIVHDPHLPALEKLQRFFVALAHWKTAQKAFFLALLRVWYADENAVVREKVRATGVKRVTPMLTVVVHQGIQEGAFTTSYPDRIGEVVLSIGQGLEDAIAGLILSFEPNRDDLQRIERTVAAYTDAFERVLGAPAGSLHLVDAETLKDWVVAPRDNP